MEQLDIKLDVENVVDTALSKGRESNIFANNYKIIKNKFNNENIELPIQYDKEELEKIISETGQELPGGVKEYTYSVEESELIITSGTDGIVIDEDGRTVSVDGKPIELSLREYELLKYLIDNKGIALSRDKILNNVWNYDYYGDSRTIDSHIKKLRHKLGKKGKYIETMRGVGYKFEVKGKGE
jgi:two-component SAPR family response regulator